MAATPGRLARQADVASQEAGLDRSHLLQWILAYAGLSAAWHLQAGEREQAEATLEVAQIATAALHR